MPRAEDIVRFDDSPPPAGASPWVAAPAVARVEVVDPDPTWPTSYELLRERVTTALGDRALAIEHVGSTSVPGLPAKPIIDIDVLVADSADEGAYLPDLEAAGFVLQIREPWWQEHRCLVFSEPRSNLHVWSPDASEPARHRIFRDWLRTHPADLALYRDAKREAAAATNLAGEDVMAYNRRKQDVVREIYGRAFHAAGLLDGPAS
jgi:GrpB-like predicted nucleotidyltransferase (UPF0157 family)